MNSMYYNLGQTLKIIRENKGYTQQEIADDKMSRSNYTKVENDEINPNVVKFFAILDHMDMSEPEFTFILNGYKLRDKDNIMYLFQKMNHSPTLSYIQNMIEVSQELLDTREDHMVRDILNLSLGYRALIEEKDLKKARAYADNVWDRLKELDKLYLSEFHLLNRILYFFELETAVSLTDMALRNLDEYFCFQEADDLKLSYLSNLACMLIDNKQYDRAMIYVEHLIKESKKESNVIVLAAALVRQGMILDANGNPEKSAASFESAIDMFKMMGRDDMVKDTKENPRIVYNAYGHVNLNANQ